MKGPRRPKGTPPITQVYTVRLPNQVGQHLAARAQADGLTAGSVIRRAIVSALDADPVEVVPVRRYRPTRPPPSIEVQAIAGLREAVGEAVGTLRQVAGIDRSHGGARLDEIDAAITDLIAAAGRLDMLKALHEAAHD